MNINRKSIAAGLTVGVLAGGAGGAIAASTSGSRIATTPSTTTSTATRGWTAHGYGWGVGANGLRGPGTRGDSGASGSDTNIAGTRCESLARSSRRASQAYLGMSASQVDSRWQSGKTLAEIASSQGKSVAGLERAIDTAVTDSVNADSALSSSQKSSIIANLKSIVDSVITGTWDGPVGPRPGWPGGPMTGAGW
jgi:hypothetical protein